MQSKKARQNLLSIVYSDRSLCCSKNTSCVGLVTPYPWDGEGMPGCLEVWGQGTSQYGNCKLGLVCCLWQFLS